MLHQGMDTDDDIWLVLHQPRLHLPEKWQSAEPIRKTQLNFVKHKKKIKIMAADMNSYYYLAGHRGTIIIVIINKRIMIKMQSSSKKKLKC